MSETPKAPKFGFWSRVAALAIIVVAILTVCLIVAGADHLIDNGPDSRPLPALLYGCLGLFALGTYVAQIMKNVPDDWDALKATNWPLFLAGLMFLGMALVADRVIVLPCFAVTLQAC